VDGEGGAGMGECEAWGEKRDLVDVTRPSSMGSY
jgi:hypothetical protein